MPRQLAGKRQISVGSKPEMGRRLVPSAPNDGKPSAVLDTGIIHAALMQKKQGKIGASTLIIDKLKIDEFHIFYTYDVLQEYVNELNNNAVAKGHINKEDIAPLIEHIKSKNNAVRMFVDPVVDGTDSHVFGAALSSNSVYIVTLDNKGAFKKYKFMQKLGQLKIVSPAEFLNKVLGNKK